MNPSLPGEAWSEPAQIGKLMPTIKSFRESLLMRLGKDSPLGETARRVVTGFFITLINDGALRDLEGNWPLEEATNEV